ncbi:MAG: sulfotransferase domain-containing protein [Pseudomonadota bacterium]
MLIPLPLSPGLSKRRVNFLIAGVQKAGTTALYEALSTHPDVEMANRKEVHFFDKRPPTGIANIDDWLYHRAFNWPARGPNTIFGEATPSYIWWSGALDRIKAYNPDIKLIILLRDPVERAWSQHWMDVSLGRKDADFQVAMDAELAADQNRPDRVHSMLSRGLYLDQVQTVLDLFPNDQLLFLRTEDMAADWPTAQNRVCRLLGIHAARMPYLPQANETPQKPDIPTDIREQLIAFFKEDAQATRRLLGWDQGSWCV